MSEFSNMSCLMSVDDALANLQRGIDYIKKMRDEPSPLAFAPIIVPPGLYHVLDAQEQNRVASNRHTRQAVRIARQRWKKCGAGPRIPHKQVFCRARWAEPDYFEWED